MQSVNTIDRDELFKYEDREIHVHVYYRVAWNAFRQTLLELLLNAPVLENRSRKRCLMFI